MQKYRIYYLCRSDIRRAEAISATDDPEAIQLAEARAGELAVQLWRDDVLVRQIAPKGAGGL